MKALCRSIKLIVLIFVITVLFPAGSLAYWQANGNPLCTAVGSQAAPVIVSDGAGGAIVAWHDLRSGHWRVYAQRIDSTAAVRWTLDGVSICPGTDDQVNPELVTDGTGGAIVTWYDGRRGEYDIYAQRVDADGLLKWSAEGVAICTTGSFRGTPQICTDGAGGAIVTWHDVRIGNSDIFAQRVDANGIMKWTGEGAPVCTSSFADEVNPRPVSDGEGGAVIAWEDDRFSYSSVFVQRIDSLGAIKWIVNGVAVCGADSSQANPMITSDNAEGAVIAWEDNRSGQHNIYAQRVDSLGSLLWGSGGIPVDLKGSIKNRPRIFSGPAGRTAFAWEDTLGGSWDIYAQRVDGIGLLEWTGDGAPAVANVANQLRAEIVPDGLGGLVAAWEDYRGADCDIYAQRLTSLGAPGWVPDGIAVSKAPGDQRNLKLISNGSGGAIITWEDNRSGNSDIYVARVEQSGVGIMFASATARIERGTVNLSWRTSVDLPEALFLIRRSSVTGETRIFLDVDVRKDGFGSYSCTDRSVLAGNTYLYEIVLTGPSGEEVYGPIEVVVEESPLACRVYQSYPNPFNPICTIRYELPNGERVRLQILDVKGTLVRTLVDERREAGIHSEVWDGRGDDGKTVNSGVYFCAIKAGDLNSTLKIVLLE